MSDESKGMSPALKILIKVIVNGVLLYWMDRSLSQYISIFGGPAAFVILASLLTLMNLFVRPILKIIFFPVSLFFTIAGTLLLNGLFLWIVYEIALKMDPDIVLLAITGGFTGWMVVSMMIGISNWVMRHILG